MYYSQKSVEQFICETLLGCYLQTDPYLSRSIFGFKNFCLAFISNIGLLVFLDMASFRLYSVTVALFSVFYFKFMFSLIILYTKMYSRYFVLQATLK